MRTRLVFLACLWAPAQAGQSLQTSTQQTLGLAIVCPSCPTPGPPPSDPTAFKAEYHSLLDACGCGTCHPVDRPLDGKAK